MRTGKSWLICQYYVGNAPSDEIGYFDTPDMIKILKHFSRFCALIAINSHLGKNAVCRNGTIIYEKQ
jgi:hypothetical protein